MGSQRFDQVGEKLSVTTTMTQGDRKVMLHLPNNAEMESMLQVMLKGMVFVTGYWHDPHMNWLDKEGCGEDTEEHCSKKPAYISNWRLMTNLPEPVPEEGESGKAATDDDQGTTPEPDSSEVDDGEG